jgi:hypothetical protein
MREVGSSRGRAAARATAAAQWTPAKDSGALGRSMPRWDRHHAGTAKHGPVSTEEKLSLVIPLVIPPHTTRHDGTVPAGRRIRSDQRGWHPARRDGRLWVDF